MTVRVLLVDDHDLLRQGLAAILGTDAGLDVVGECPDGPSAVRRARLLEPDVVLMDIEMPGGDGLTATAQILAAQPAVRVMVLTTFDLDEYVLAALRAGASGFLVKTMPPAKIVAAVKACAAGETMLGPTVLDRLVASYVQRPDAAAFPGLDTLTDREREVLLAMAKGLSNVEIGEALYLAETTVKTHVTRVLAKLGVRDRVQAVVIAHRSGLVTGSG
ncbi:response regulator transcription factor [Georgenia yuyongxinii]|uniref:Response regulator transcription factor n=1 Tax=Georgenia yuyongxinii TaxID=2589797 RepID=A0A5B8C4U9_9MICO|nr:response regulator transcription factor [Georgenia yuyongxinii]QDC25799.1 response regulator transcription factor [Georgenia yuyongxinii]